MTIVEVDPDPTPTATPWQEYLAAAQSLDAVHRGAAAGPAGGPAGEALSELGQRLERQRAQLTGEAVRAGLPAPQLTPTGPELAAAREATAAIAASPTASLTASVAAGRAVPEVAAEQLATAILWRCRSLLDAGAAQLAAPAPPRRSWPPAGSLVPVLLIGAAALLAGAGLVLLVLVLTG